MELAPHLQPNAGAAPPPKLAIDKFADGNLVCLKLAGTIDESFEGKRLADSLRASTLILDLGDIRKVSSFGIREWVDFITAVGKTAQRIVLVECAPKIVDQLNMVANFAGTGRVYSFYAPYHCDYCDRDDKVLLQVDRDHEQVKSMKPAQRACASCGEMQYFNEDPVTFFSYLAGQEKFELDPDVAGFLAAKLSYAVADGARKLRVEKTIEGRVTFIKLHGDLDKTFPRDKLAEGLEGTVVVDVGGVGKIEPAGAAEWRGLLQQVTPLVEAIYLTAVPPGFLDKLTRPEDLGPKAAVMSLTLPYTCAKCSTTAGQLIEVDTHFEVLKFATPPDLKCADCKGPLTCAAPEGLLANLPKLARPNVAPELAKLVREVRERKPAPKRPTTTAALVAAEPARGGGLGMAFVAALAAVALGAAVLVGYRMFFAKGTAPAGRGGKTAASAEARPAWATTEAPLAASCTDEGGGLRCVGVSGLAPTSDDATIEAGEAALDGLAVALGERITDPTWKTHVGAQYREARAAKLAAAEKDARSAQARRVVRDARAGVAKALRAMGAPAGESYWEEYTGAAGKQYVGFATVTVTGAQIAKMLETYQASASALGVTAVSAFPLLAWRYPDVTRGAIVTAVGDGALGKAGLTAGYVVLSVGGARVADAPGFAQLATDEATRLAAVGGSLRLEVQAGDGEARSFSAPIAATRPPDDGRGSGGSGGGTGGRTGGSGTGNINVWDRLGGGSGQGRDDPTQ